MIMNMSFCSWRLLTYSISLIKYSENSGEFSGGRSAIAKYFEPFFTYLLGKYLNELLGSFLYLFSSLNA